MENIETVKPDELDANSTWPIELQVTCSATVFAKIPITFDRWAPLNYLVGPNGSGKTTLFNSIMEAARNKWPKRVKILGTGRLGPLEKSVTRWIGETQTGLFQEENLDTVYNNLFDGQDTSHQAFQLLEKRLDLQIRVLGFLRHVFNKTIYFKSTRRGLQIVGAAQGGGEYQIIDECHGLKELVTILTFLYDDTFSVLGIDEPELHLHPQFQRFLLDELRAVAGSPDQKGKKLIFLVTHSPIFLEMRHLRDLSSIVVFSPESPPRRAEYSELSTEDRLKVQQALPSFHAAQREPLFSNSPIIVEGPTDSAVLLNVAAKLELPLGAAGLGIAAMGGKYQLQAFRALMISLSKPATRFVVDLDAATDTKSLHCLDADSRVVAHLAAAGAGGRTLTQIAGELIGLLRQFVESTLKAGKNLGPIKAGSDFAAGALAEKQLAIVLRVIRKALRESDTALDMTAATAINGKFNLVRSAARAANVLILANGPIEAYYESVPDLAISDFQKQQAFQGELDSIWNSTDLKNLENRYAEMIEFVCETGLLKIPIGDMAREPLANLIHLLQSEILAGRITNIETAKSCSRAKSDGYWYVCELTELIVVDHKTFKGTINVKSELGGEVIKFDNNTRAYELTLKSAEKK